MAKKILLSNGASLDVSALAVRKSMYTEAEQKRKTFSQLLEEIDPTPDGCPVDAFERQLIARDIQTKTVYTKAGDVVYSSNLQTFFQTDDNLVLFPEFVNRNARMAIVRDVMLNALLAKTTPIPNGSGMRSFYIDDQTEDVSNVRIVEGTDLPLCEIKGKDKLNKPRKYGRAVKMSYEYRSDITIDMFALLLQMKAIGMAKDMVSDIIKTIQDGDGNSNPAPVYRMKADLVSGATVGTLSYEAFLRFLLEFEEFPCNRLVCSKDAFIQVLLTNNPTLTANEVLKLLSNGKVTFSVDSPQLPKEALTMFWHKNITGNKIIGLNQEAAIERLFVIGSDVNEQGKNISNQTELYTMSERDTFAKIFDQASKILDIDQ